jgi:SSS family transporter
MTWIADHWLPLLFVGAYLVLMAYHGWKGGRKSKTLDHFLIGGRGLGGVVVGLSYYATFVSSVTFIGHSGKSYTAGPSWWLVCVVVFTAMVLISWIFIAPPFVEQARKLGSLTIPDFLGRRYRSNLIRRVAGFAVVAGSVIYMGSVYEAAAVSLGEMLNLQHLHVTLLIFLVVTAYTLAGGFHSVVSTDAVQGLILAVIAVLVPAAMMYRQGGLVPLLDAVREAEPRALEFRGGAQLMGMIGLALGVGFKFLVEPRQLSRFYGLSSLRQLRIAAWIAPALLMTTFMCMLPVGFLSHAYVPEQQVRDAAGKIDTDKVVPYLLSEADVLGPVLGAFFLTGLIAAAMSSLDSVLLVAASSADHDLLQWGRDSAAVMRNTRIWIIVLSAAAAGVSLFPGLGVVGMSSLSGTLYTACFLPTLVVGLFWRRATTAGAVAALLVGFAVTLGWYIATKQFTPLNYVHEMFVGPPIALAVYWLVSLATKPVGWIPAPLP